MTDVDTTDDDVFDLNAAADEQKAKRQPWKLSWGKPGQKWTMENAFNLDLALIERAENGDVSAIREALKHGLGEQHDDFMKAKALDLGALTILFNRWIERSGSKAGESGASSGS